MASNSRHRYHRQTQLERDQEKGTKTRVLKKGQGTVYKHVSIPSDVWDRVEDLQARFKADYGINLSTSAAVASLIRNAPAYSTMSGYRP